VKLVDFNAEMKLLYSDTPEGQAMRDRMKAERAERNKDIAALIDERGYMTMAGSSRLIDIAYVVEKVMHGHNDNTGLPCRIDLDGHDCCYVCNQAEDMLRATAKYYEDGQ